MDRWNLAAVAMLFAAAPAQAREHGWGRHHYWYHHHYWYGGPNYGAPYGYPYGYYGYGPYYAPGVSVGFRFGGGHRW